MSVSKKGIFKSELSAKLLARILLISGLFTLATTAIQLYINYNKGINELNHEVSLIGPKFSTPLTRAVWELNHLQTNTILDSIKNYESVSFVDILYTKGTVESSRGSREDSEAFDFEFPLIFEFSGVTSEVGYLRVVADKEKVIQEVYDSFYLILFSQIIKTFFVSLLILLIFHQLIIRHVREISLWLESFNPQKPFYPIAGSKPKSGDDEIVFLKSSINDMGKLVCEHTQSLEKMVEQRTIELKRQTDALEEAQTELHKILLEKEQKIQEVSKSTSYWLWELDSFGNISSMHEDFSELIGLSSVNHSPQAFIDVLTFIESQEMKDAEAKLKKLISERKPIEAFDCQLRTVAGDIIWVEMSAVPKFDQHGQYCGYHGSTQNLTQQKHLEKLAYTDGLTGIANRVAFFHRAEKELNRGRRMAYDIGVMMLDLDYFKSINDTYGHEAGDEVLKKVSNALTSCLREEDCIGRIGGEEFAIVVAGANKSGLHNLAERLQESIKILDFPFLVEDHRITMSIGYTLVKNNEIFKTALSRSDQHLYTAKASGRNCFITDVTAISTIY